jgi:hypothetical protein
MKVASKSQPKYLLAINGTVVFYYLNNIQNKIKKALFCSLAKFKNPLKTWSLSESVERARC